MVVSAVLFFRLYEVDLMHTVIKHLLCLLSYIPSSTTQGEFLSSYCDFTKVYAEYGSSSLESRVLSPYA